MTDSDAKLSDATILESLRADVVIPDAEVRERVSSRLLLSVGAFATPPGQTSDPAVDPSAGAGGTGPAQAIGTAHVLRPLFMTVLRRPSVLALTFGLGAGAGAVLHAALEAHPEPKIIYVTAQSGLSVIPPTGERPAATSAVEHAAEPESTSTEANSLAPVGSEASAPARASLAGLAAQQVLLDAARAALGRGDNQSALRAIQTHLTRYPSSVLAEEREALTIKALVGLGRFADARARGARFRDHFPQSLLLQSVNETLASIP
jgi:hypothetical protein